MRATLYSAGYPGPEPRSRPATSMAEASTNQEPTEAQRAETRKALIPIFIIVFIDVLGLTLIIPILPLYAQRFGAADLTVGLLLSSFAVCQFFASPFLGRISDSVGRKPVLIASQIGMLASYVVLGFATNLWMVFVGRIIAGITAGNLSIAQAYISDVTRPEERTRTYGLIGVAFGAGFMFGPPIAGFLMEWHTAAPFFAAAILSGLSATVTALLLPHREPAPAKQGARRSRIGEITELFARPEPRRRLVEFFAFQLAFSMLMGGGFTLFLQHMFPDLFSAELRSSGRNIGLIFLYIGVIGAIIQGALVGRLAKRLGEGKLALIGFITAALGHIFLGFTVGRLWLLLALMAVGQFGLGVIRPALTTLLTKSVGRDEQGKALGVSTSLTSITQIVCPIIAASLIHAGYLTGYGLTVAAFAALGAILVMQRSAPVAAIPVTGEPDGKV